MLHQATEFRPSQSTKCGNMKSYTFLKMVGATAKYYFRFRICWCHCVQKVKVYQRTRFCRHISIDGWDITTSVFEKQTSAVLLFYFRFRSRAFAVICMLFCLRLPNFIQIGAPVAEIWCHIHFPRWRPQPLNTTSGFVFVDVTAFRKSKSISKPNLSIFSILRWDITTSGFEKQTSALLEFYFRVDLDHFAVIGVLFCIRLPNFVQVGAHTAEYNVISIFKMAAVIHVVFALGVMADHRRSAFRGLNSVL